MAIGITSEEDFERKFQERKHASDLFAFFLFDDRPSSQAVERFARDEFTWLDQLAASARMFFFVFIRHDESRDRVANPSLEVAEMFGILPNQLPGVVIFTLSEDGHGVSDGAYLPLKAELFAEDIAHVEEVFSDIFSLIKECRKEGGSPSELLENVRRRMKRLERTQRMRPLLMYAKKSLESLASLPRDVVIAGTEAFAAEAARGALGPGTT